FFKRRQKRSKNPARLTHYEESKKILDELEVGCGEFEKGYYCADSVESVSTICSKTIKAGARIFNLISAEDVMMTDGRVTGLVINWTAVGLGKLHVDPLVVRAKYVIDATGHDAEVAKFVQNKSGCMLNTPTGKVIGEKPMDADAGERDTVENTKEVFPGLYVTGMSCNAAYGSPRMGPVFGGMLLSGKKAAEDILGRLG
ncbi:MAG: sulfide-dependent adenosine diphosphate thiazole synthase, partial [Spirochaetia bacterium]|nr:sulfide-dependent adenosine diphosphate thiazole synthase [Spirochaetia bacterium]